MSGQEPAIDRSLLERGARPAGAATPRSQPGREPAPGRALACSECERIVTSTDSRIEVAGAHAHTFANPDGYTFRIGCFARAHGLAGVGERSTFATWFAGYTWRAEVCGGCGEHIGWLYQGPSNFHGLILDRLVEIDERTH